MHDFSWLVCSILASILTSMRVTGCSRISASSDRVKFLVCCLLFMWRKTCSESSSPIERCAVRTRSEIVRLAESKVGRCASNHKMRDLLARKSKSPCWEMRAQRDRSPIRHRLLARCRRRYLYLTTFTTTSWHLGHSKVRLSWSGLSGSIATSHVDAPQLSQRGVASNRGCGTNSIFLIMVMLPCSAWAVGQCQ